jgi:Type 9 secretion system plug protein 1st domain
MIDLGPNRRRCLKNGKAWFTVNKFFILSRLRLISALFLILHFSPVVLGADFENFTTKDMIFSESIKTVQFYRTGSFPQEIFNTAATSLDQGQGLLLKFDFLGDEAPYMYVKIFHCNSDWTVSNLVAAEYLYDYNEFLIETYDFSFNTKTSFTHYQFTVPRLRHSGNYILVIYDSEDPETILMTRRFFIYENLVEIKTNFIFSTKVEGRRSRQQLDFLISYHNYFLQDPETEIKVTLRQNYRWDNSIIDLPPLYVDLNDKSLDYRYFDYENSFKGGNEFRSFALRHLNFTDINLKSINSRSMMAEVLPMKIRSNRSFVNDVDINGKFFIENSTGGRFDLDGDYFRTIFKFEPKITYPGRIFVMGELSDWKLKPEFEMLYDKENNWYITSAFIKQGYYNYYLHYLPDLKYPNPDIDEYYLEGSFFQTENIYEIIIYHRPPGGRADKIVGYLVKDFAN